MEVFSAGVEARDASISVTDHFGRSVFAEGQLQAGGGVAVVCHAVANTFSLDKI